MLWARKWAENLMDQLALLPNNQDLKAAVTNLGLGYNLLTRFTAFVANDGASSSGVGAASAPAWSSLNPSIVSIDAVSGKASALRRTALPILPTPTTPNVHSPRVRPGILSQMPAFMERSIQG